MREPAPAVVINNYPVGPRAGNRTLVPSPTSVLAFRHAHDEAVEFRRDLDLAGQPAVGFEVLREVEHRLFHVLLGVKLSEPGLIDIDMAGGAGAGAAAIGI